ncbi:MAG: hypothetical protein EBY32_07585 [Proteobacteria bacterium]|nr:hypothetical protein [Pseudomonadota bacterium]
MSELLRKAVETMKLLKKKPHLKPVAAGGGELSKAERWRTAQMAQDWLNANADPKYHRRRLPDMEDNGQFKLLTRGRLGMRLKEFRYYQPPGGYYGNPYDKDFAQEKQKERRNGLIKAGIVGAGLLGGGALLGRGLYKVGNSGAVRRAEDLAEELSKLRASKAAANVGNVGNVGNAAPAPRGRKTQNNTPPPTPPQTPTPTPPPQTPPPTPPPTNVGKGSKTTPKTKVVESLNNSGDLPAADAAAEIDEITAAKPPRKLTARQQKLANRQAKVAKFAAAQSGGTASVPSTPAPAAPVVPKTPVAAKTEPPAAPASRVESIKASVQRVDDGVPAPKVASATNEEFWEKKGVGKVPLLGTPEQNAALRKRLEDTHAAGGFNGKVAADVIDEARASLKPKSDFPEGLSDKLRAAGKENNPKPKGKKNSKKKKDEADDDSDPGASDEEADWEESLTGGESEGKKPAAKKPAAKGKGKGKKEEAPLSFADKIAAKVKAKRDKKPAAKKNGKNLSALLHRVRYFNQFQTDEAGIPLTGRVARDRFVKKLRDEDLDRRDANILRAGGAGALAGLLARGRIGASKRALIGAGAGGLGVIGIRALTNNDRDIYGERNRGSKRAELLPAVGGLGAAAWLAGKRLKAFAKKIDHRGHRGHGGVKEFNDPHRPDWAVHPSGGSLHVQSLVYKPQNYVPRWGMRRLLASKSDKVRSDAFDQAMRERERRRGLREAAMQNLSARLRGVKNFDDYRLYYFKGRNTGIAARSAEEARKKKKRGGDELVAVRTPSDSERSQMARGVWVRTRRDGKSPGQSRYGKGRGQGPARKSLSAKLRGLKEFGVLKSKIVPVIERGIDSITVYDPFGHFARKRAKYTTQQAKHARAQESAHAARMSQILGSKWSPDHGDSYGAKFYIKEAKGYRKQATDRFKRDAVVSGAGLTAAGAGAGYLATRKEQKQLAAKIRVRFFEGKRFGPPAGFYDKNSPEYWNSPERKAEREVLWQENLRKENARIPRHLRAQGWSWAGRWDGKKGGGSIYRDQDGKDHYIGKDGFKGFSARLRAINFSEKREKGMNPYVGAGLSGFGSGAALGSLALLKRGATFRGAAKTAAKLGLASAGIVGGGALLGSKIVGDPRKEESAPFMKRAAIGGTLVGAGAGLGGALLLRKTKGGARALVAASKKSEPFSRPAMWLRKTPLAGAAAIGAVGGAFYGGGMGADEGQQVDSIRNLRKDMKKFSTKIKLREFSAMADTAKRAAKAVGGWAKRNGTAIGLTGAGVGASVAASRYYGPSNKGWKKLDEPKEFGRGDQARWDATRGGGVQSNEDSQFANVPLGWATDRPMYIPKRDSQGRVQKDPDTGEAIRVKWDPSSGQLWNSIAREAKNKRVTVQRGGRLSRDLVDELRGAPRQRDASGRIKKREWEKSWFHNKATEIGMTAAGLGGLATVRYANNNPDTKIGKAYTNTQASLRATKDGLSEIGGNILKGITKVTAKRAFSAKLRKLRELDAIAEYEGWDIRDPRGRSARVFAPGSRRRERRPKEWHEKTENERKLWKAGIAAGVLGGVGLTLVGQRLVSGKSLIPSRFLKKKPIDPSKFADAPPSAKEADEILKKYSK